MSITNIAAVVVTHRSERHIEACLEALLGAAPALPVVVWDNDSPDRSADLAEAHSARVQVVRSGENLGFAAAVNRVAAAVPDADLFLVNPDTVLHENAPSVLAGALAGNPGIGVVSSALAGLDGSPRPDCWAFPTPMRTVAGAAVGLGRAYAARRRRAGGVDVIADGFVPFTAALVRRAVFDVLGGLDEGYWMYGEDADYCYRARRAGWSIAVAPRAVARHLGGASSQPAERAEAVLRGGDRFRQKFFSPPACRAASSALRWGAAARLSWGSVAARFIDHPKSRAEWQLVRRHYRRAVT